MLSSAAEYDNHRRYRDIGNVYRGNVPTQLMDLFDEAFHAMDQLATESTVAN